MFTLKLSPLRPLLACAALTLPALLPAAVPQLRLDRLTRGINLSHWFSQIPTEDGSYQHAWFNTYDRPADFQLLAHAGFRHVRFPVEFEMFMDEAQPDTLRPEFLPDFDRAMDAILGAGLSVIVDWHAREETKHRLGHDDAFVERADRLWRAMARHLATRDPDRVFLETMNEPAGMELARWWPVQERFVKAIRDELPRSTIIVSPYQWGGLDEMVKTAPYADDNIVYNFHFYEPMVFTHQSAAWPGMGLEPIRNLAYPVTQASLQANLKRVGDGKGRVFLLDYHADRAWVAARFRIAADWAAAHRVPITCNEFGVYANATPQADRYRWIRDTREICEQLGIGWSMWDYAGGFAVTSDTTPGHRKLDPKCLRALGLKSARR
jgi:aryl-phospho-beta-D-glucosidase BglC (GH1 family)